MIRVFHAPLCGYPTHLQPHSSPFLSRLIGILLGRASSSHLRIPTTGDVPLRSGTIQCICHVNVRRGNTWLHIKRVAPTAIGFMGQSASQNGTLHMCRYVGSTFHHLVDASQQHGALKCLVFLNQMRGFGGLSRAGLPLVAQSCRANVRQSRHFLVVVPSRTASLRFGCVLAALPNVMPARFSRLRL